jgi:hypothetical protein
MDTTISLPRVLALAAACLLIGSTGGAVAGGLVTGRDVKNGSLTGKDVKNRSLSSRDLSAATIAALHGATGPAGAAGAAGTPGAPGVAGADGVSGWELVETDKAVAAATATHLNVSCPTGKLAVGGSGYWQSSSAAVQVVLIADGSGVDVYTTGIPASDDLHAQVICATVDGPKPRSSGPGKAAPAR